jgi:hypothetical protein
MRESRTNGTGSRALTFLAMSAAMVTLFCFAAIPSAKATVTTYDVNVTSGSPTCASTTGVVTIDSTADTFEFTDSSAGCYFGGVGPGTTTTDDYGPTGAGDCKTNCTPDLATLPPSTDITFQGSQVGGCSTSSTCTTSSSGYMLDMVIPSLANGGFKTTTSFVALEGSHTGGNTAFTIDFDDATLSPEPASYLLFGSGLLGLGAIFRKKLGRAV